jgi:Zn-dependent protease with chaperone function
MLLIASAILCSQDRIKAIASSLANEYRKSYPRVDDATVQDYVAALAARLAPDKRYSVEVMMSSQGEAAALPNGRIFVPARLLRDAAGEREFALVLAHAMIHIGKNHFVRSAVVNAEGVPSFFSGGWTGDLSVMPISFRDRWKPLEDEAVALAPALVADIASDSQAFHAARARLRKMTLSKPPTLRRAGEP